MRQTCATAVGLVVMSSMLGCGAPSERNGASQGEVNGMAITAAKVPDVVDVFCSASGTKVSTAVVAARADGVHVRVRKTPGLPGVYLNYSYDGDPTAGRRGGGGGDGGVGVLSSERVLSIPAGPVRFNCSTYEHRKPAKAVYKKDPPFSIEVQDPTRAWRTGALAALDCAPPKDVVISYSWVFGPGRGPTPEVALKDLIAQTRQPATWHAAQEGYVAAARQGYVLRRDGAAWATANVTRQAARDYTAGLDVLCNDTAHSLRAG